MELKEKFLNCGCELALFSDSEEFTSNKKGISALLELAESGKAFSSAGDKIVGKAAALLMVKLGVKNVYAEVISLGAIGVFEKYGVKFSFGEKCEYIINRKGDGMCPMESAVSDTLDVFDALSLLRAKVNELSVK